MKRHHPALVSLFFIFAVATFPNFHLQAQGAAVETVGAEELPAALTPAPLETSWAVSWWMPRHREKLADSSRVSANLLFIGDSITHYWEDQGAPVWNEYFGDREAFNLGYSGDRTENVLWRLENGEVDGMNPELVVMMIGTNNTGHRQDPADVTARGVEEILNELEVRLPESEILLLAIFPRGETPEDPLRSLNSEINTRIAGLADNERVFFLDINDVFLDDEGNLPEDIMPDMLHPNEYGYQLWAEAMEPTLVQLLSSE